MNNRKPAWTANVRPCGPNQARVETTRLVTRGYDQPPVPAERYLLVEGAGDNERDAFPTDRADELAKQIRTDRTPEQVLQGPFRLFPL